MALDVPSLLEAEALVRELHDVVDLFKVGLQLFTASGPAAVHMVRRSGADCFLDLKLHDIPATMRSAVSACAQLDVAYLTVHAQAGRASLEAAVMAAQGTSTRLLAVTVLTSLDDASLQETGHAGDATQVVGKLAEVAYVSGISGFVSSSHEAAHLRRQYPQALLVVPGIRPQSSGPNDQKRTATPAEAVLAGANILVVGRPIRAARSPRDAALELKETLAHS